MSPPHEQLAGAERVTKTYSFEVDPDDQLSSHGMVIAMVGRGRRVLEVGCGAGHVSRHLVARGNDVVGIDIDPGAVQAARQILDDVHCCDLDMVAASSLVTGPFDVIVLADVLEHVRHPDRVLADLLGLLAPDGRVVMSIPNVAHIDVRLMLLLGEWTYQPLGLLDDSHLRWFTRRAIADLLRAAGLEPREVRRTVAGAFGSSLELPRERIPDELITALLADPDATTFQFVIEAARVGGDWSLLADRGEATVQLPDPASLRAEAAAARAETASLRQVLTERELELADERNRTARLVGDAEALRSRVAELEAADAAWRATKLVRYSAPLRRLWARVRQR